MKRRKHILAIICLLATVNVVGQGFYNRGQWKRYRNEFSAGIGVSNFLGDLGGRDLVGSDFIWDLEISQTKMAVQFNHMYYLARKIGMRTNLSYAKVAGDDALTQEMFRHNRNLNFESKIYEASMIFEIQFVKENVGNIYNLRSTTGKRLGLRSLQLGFYGVVGIGGFYYNPMGIAANGAKVELRPLRTEGQGLPGGPDQYGKFSLAVPVGLGIRRSFNRFWGMKLEMAHRFTFTDYIDDVSTVYYNNNDLATEVSPLSAQMADPSLGEIGWTTTGAGMQRGDPSDKDGYMYLTVSIYRRIKGNKNPYGQRRVRRVKASF